MKHGHDSSKEFCDFLRESCTVEETYAKLLAKLAKFSSNCGSKGSFGPFWQVLRCLAEKLSNLHMQLVYSWQELMKDVHRYTDEQHKKHKAVKDNESVTMETVQSIQQTILALHKAKETYHARCLEYERLKREGVAQKEIEKAEAKFKKSNDEYRSLVDKYTNVRNDFETRMIVACKKFQELEEQHLAQMKDFVETYAKAWENQLILLQQVHEEFRTNRNEFTVEKLTQMLMESKTTGTEKPGPIEFVEADLSTLPPLSGTPDLEKKEIPILEKPKKEGTGFLSKRKREKKKKKKDKDTKSDGSTGSGSSEKKDPTVDEEGFSIRPNNPLEAAFADHEDMNNWYSSSDTDSESEDRRKIKVEIKPVKANGTTPDNVDVLRRTVEGLRLSPTTVQRQTPTMESNNMKRSASVSETLKAGGKPSQDLLGLDLFGLSNDPSPSGGGVYNFPELGLRKNSATSVMSSQTSAMSTPTPGCSDFFLDSPIDASPQGTGRRRSQTPTSAALLPGPPVPRPAPRTNFPMAALRSTQRSSPTVGEMARTDSVPSLNSVAFNTTSAPYGCSRGPSPLTIGMSDSIPLAVAFSETANAYFIGADPKKCRVKLTGDMVVSFPAGIVRLIMDNPSPAVLSFCIKNTTSLQQILVNKQLIIEDTSQSTSDCRTYHFNMPAVADHLKRQTDQNKVASYFNIDILKYQIKTSAVATESAPLQLASYWKCEATHTDFHLKYKFNGTAMMPHSTLSKVTVTVPVDGNVTNVQSKPTAVWSAEKKCAMWQLGDVSDMNEEGGGGSIHAKFDVANGPSTPSTVAIRFLCDGTTMSGIDFDLIGTGYRTSLVKKKFFTGITIYANLVLLQLSSLKIQCK
ncbi:hypothetical protein NP493_522g02037 [Ridgeia piscesae]|uniref:F-BAR domain only protein 2 n=1 Tax=Ridgeia piscesae TaxID=27915 RepID=A0AAD9KWE7_RIDPI|nr:hypothetical protein NP493_522g02037 [Ridgeia piscesae]